MLSQPQHFHLLPGGPPRLLAPTWPGWRESCRCPQGSFWPMTDSPGVQLQSLCSQWGTTLGCDRHRLQSSLKTEPTLPSIGLLAAAPLLGLLLPHAPFPLPSLGMPTNKSLSCEFSSPDLHVGTQPTRSSVWAFSTPLIYQKFFKRKSFHRFWSPLHTHTLQECLLICF